MRKGKVYVYDSIYSTLNDFVIKQLCNCYHSLANADNELTVVLPGVYMQSGTIDCGLFSTAYAYDIASGIYPEDVIYNQSNFRRHFNDCISHDRILSFPRYIENNFDQLIPPMKETKTQTIVISCYCKQPPTTNMVKCNLCQENFHLECIESTSSDHCGTWM